MIQVHNDIECVIAQLRQAASGLQAFHQLRDLPSSCSVVEYDEFVNQALHGPPQAPEAAADEQRRGIERQRPRLVP